VTKFEGLKIIIPTSTVEYSDYQALVDYVCKYNCVQARTIDTFTVPGLQRLISRCRDTAVVMH